MNNFLKYYRTIIYLKPRQVYFQFWYRIKNATGVKRKEKKLILKGHPLKIQIDYKPNPSYDTRLNLFCFLNLKKRFIGQIDWNISDYGKLWTYNLNYFDYLCQETMSAEKGLELINDYVFNYKKIKDGKEPYPTSLRIMNWIKFMSFYSINDSTIDQYIAKDTNNLLNNLEYHLMGNHLLENAFALYFAALYFKSEEIKVVAKKVLIEQLNEQILNDGAHFEQSPMYHNIILSRLLDLISLLNENQDQENDLITYLREKAIRMVSWIKKLSLASGLYPKFNDSAYGIGLSLPQIFSYSERLNLIPRECELSESGYRRFSTSRFDLFIKLGNIKANYIPGHSHSDCLHYVLFVNQKPFIVDIGISTYNKNNRRQWERSTDAHNTVSIDRKDQTEVWGGFRVGRRAITKIISQNQNVLEAEHNGYEHIGIVHRRIWQTTCNRITITDFLEGNSSKEGIAKIHFAPKLILRKIDRTVVEVDGVQLSVEGAINMYIFEYNYPIGFNKLCKAQGLAIRFENSTKTNIEI